MTDAILAIDAGGTVFKYALVDKNGHMLTEVFKMPVESSGTKNDILNCYKNLVNHAKNITDGNITGIGISTPGPFDYETGTSYMKHKFTSLYGIPLREEIKEFCGINVPVWFCSDTNSFLVGETEFGAGRNYKNLLGVTIGTGLGLAIVLDRKIHTNENQGPAEIVFNLPTRGRILEDFVSGRGIAEYYKNISGKKDEELSAKDVSLLAKTDEKAQKTFDETGFLLGEMLKEFVKKYNAEAVILGGQVSNSFELMEAGIKRGLGETECNVLKAESIDESALKGLMISGNKYTR
ncbi:MAG: ROK family protein [Clostridia bacterium]|nr:ROK family protein [Clostridia bacterium]